MRWQFLIPIACLLVAIIINLVYLHRKRWDVKRNFKAWVVLVLAYFIVVDAWAFIGAPVQVLKNGTLTALGVALLALALALETWIDLKREDC